ncbi:unnamed protein product [Linum trigynum]|uniref:Uncharacterized protein n=1 Tax=Linum trigynum TaxID=586398 RepID=A0AAV2FCH7_9ROSI
MLRARYHPNIDIIEAELGYRPSYIWRSLISVNEFLRQGTRWVVGNGTSIRVWGDRWIPTTLGLFVSSAPRELSVTATVRDLIKTDEEM